MVSETLMQFTTFLSEAVMLIIALHMTFQQRIRVDCYLLFYCMCNCVICYGITKEMISIYFAPLVYLMPTVYCLIRFRERLLKTIFRIVLAFVFMGQMETAASFVIVFLGKDGANAYSLMRATILASCFTCVFYLFVIKKSYAILTSKPLIFLAAISGCYVVSTVSEYRSYRSSINIVIIVVFCLFLSIYVYLLRIQNVKSDLANKNIELQMQKIYGENYEELLNRVRKRQHDYKNRISALSGLQLTVELGDEVANVTEEYLKQLQEEDKFNGILTGCNQPIVAGFLYQKCTVIDQDKIELDYHLRVDQLSGWEPLHEVVELLGIFIDNAHEQCLREDCLLKKISLSLTEEQESICFTIANPAPYLTAQEIERCFELGYSSKGANRGIGLARAMEIITRQNATIEVKNRTMEGQNWIQFAIWYEK